MAFKDNLEPDLQNVFFNEDDFAEPAIYHPIGGGDYPVSLIFDEMFHEIEFKGGIRLGSTQPTATLRQSQFVAPVAEGDTITIRSSIYVVREPRQNGLGVMEIKLHWKSVA